MRASNAERFISISQMPAAASSWAKIGGVKMAILIACEESQAVTSAFRRHGIEAYSCDTEDCSGVHPEWHIRRDVREILHDKWDAIIAFPSCTYLTVAGNRWFSEARYGEAAVERKRLRIEAVEFVRMIWDSNDRVCIENPLGCLGRLWRRSTQTVHPYFFGDADSKRTCLWLKNLPRLKRTHFDVKPKIYGYLEKGKHAGNPIYFHDSKLPDADRAKIRSATFPGVAEAMAAQWAEWITAGNRNERQLSLDFNQIPH